MADPGTTQFDGRCQRCKRRAYVTTTSYFNTEIICIDCSEDERSHPDFEKAMKADEEACRRKDFNFPGIGLPADLGGNS